MTTENSKTGETTFSRMNFSGYVGHVSIYVCECLLRLAVALALGLELDLVSGWLVVRTYWQRGSVVGTSVFGWRTFPDLRLILD